MSVPAESTLVSATSDRGRRLATWSLLMVPMLAVTAILGAVVGMFLLGRRGLEGSEPMSVQGGYGWMVWAVVTFAVFLVPSMIGIVLGFKARQHGEERLGRMGMLVNGAILVGIPVAELMSMLNQ